jgi:hypothetical protein
VVTGKGVFSPLSVLLTAGAEGEGLLAVAGSAVNSSAVAVAPSERSHLRAPRGGQGGGGDGGEIHVFETLPIN